MKMNKVSELLSGKIITKNADIYDIEIRGAYVCDMLSRVISKLGSNQVWITILNSVNVIAVASLSDCKLVVLAEGVEMEESVLKKADDNKITVVSTTLTAYEICIIINKLVNDYDEKIIL